MRKQGEQHVLILEAWPTYSFGVVVADLQGNRRLLFRLQVHPSAVEIIEDFQSALKNGQTQVLVLLEDRDHMQRSDQPETTNQHRDNVAERVVTSFRSSSRTPLCDSSLTSCSKRCMRADSSVKVISAKPVPSKNAASLTQA